MKPVSRLPFITIFTLLISLTVAQVKAAPPQVQHAPGSLVRFTHLSLDDGLSQNAGLAFLQDQRGYLWIGTQDGLNLGKCEIDQQGADDDARQAGKRLHAGSGITKRTF